MDCFLWITCIMYEPYRMTASLNLRAGVGFSGSVMDVARQELLSGSRFTLDEHRGGWRQVKLIGERIDVN